MSGSTGILEELFVKISLRQDGNVVDALTKIQKGFDSLALAAVAAAGAVATAAQKMSSDLESLYFAANRMGSTASGIQAFSYAMSQLGVSSGAATGTLDAVGRFIRSTPGAGSYFRSLGVSLTDANGKIKDTAEVVLELGTSLSKMPFYRAQAYANVLGIDYTSLLALTRGLREYNDQYRALLRAAGVDTDRAAEAAHKFQVQLRLLWATVGVVFQRFFQSLGGNVTGQLTRFNKFVLDNFDAINRAVDRTARFFTLMLQVVENSGAVAYRIFTELTGTMSSVWNSLTANEKKWAEWGAGVAAALLLFDANPVLALALAFATLADDYATWANGGISKFNWQPVVDGFNSLREPVAALGHAFRELLSAVEAVTGPNTPGFDGSKLFSANAAFEDAAKIIRIYTDALVLLKTTLEWFTKHPELPEPNPDVLQRQGRSQQAPYGVIPPGSTRDVPSGGSTGPGWLRRNFSWLFGAGGNSGSRVWDQAREEIEKYLFNRDHSPSNNGLPVELERYLGGGAREMMRSIADHVNSSSWFKGEATGEAGGGGVQTIGYSTGGGGGSSVPLGGGFSSRGGTPPAGNERIQRALAFFQGRGWSLAQAAGIVANLWMESHLDPGAFNPAGGNLGAQGIAQWRGERVLAIEAQFGKKLTSMSLEEQLQAVQWELEGREARSAGALRGATTPFDAGNVFQQQFERGGATDRGAAAQNLYRGLPLGVAGGGGAPARPSTGDAPTGTGVVHVNAHTTIHVNGGGTALETANAVAREQSRVNADLVRNFKPVLI